jgi:carbon monoxide dehydrogenase subunit G
VDLSNEVTIDADRDVVWATPFDVERVASCVPGAEIADLLDDGG